MVFLHFCQWFLLSFIALLLSVGLRGWEFWPGFCSQNAPYLLSHVFEIDDSETVTSLIPMFLTWICAYVRGPIRLCLILWQGVAPGSSVCLDLRRYRPSILFASFPCVSFFLSFATYRHACRHNYKQTNRNRFLSNFPFLSKSHYNLPFLIPFLIPFSNSNHEFVVINLIMFI